MKKLFDGITGTEIMNFFDFASFLRVTVSLESLEAIVLDTLPMLPEQKELLQLTTFRFYQYLCDGHFDTTMSMFIDKRFMDYTTPEWDSVRKFRHDFVTRKFYTQVVKDAKLIMQPTEKLMPVQLIQRKRFAATTLMAAELVAEDMDMTNLTPPTLDTEMGLNNFIGKKMKKVLDIAKYAPKVPDVDLLFRFLRSDYLELQKYIDNEQE